MNGNQGSGSTGGAKGKCQVCESTTCGAVDSIPRFAVISDYFTSGGLLGLFFFPFFFLVSIVLLGVQVADEAVGSLATGAHSVAVITAVKQVSPRDN